MRRSLPWVPWILVAESDLARLRRELERLRAENIRLSRLLELRVQDTAPAPAQLSAAVAPPGLVAMSSPVEDKLALYTDRFRARTDAYAVRWENARTGVSGWMPAVAGGWRKGMGRKGATYLPLTAEVVAAHLVGDVFIGLYPLLTFAEWSLTTLREPRQHVTALIMPWQCRNRAAVCSFCLAVGSLLACTPILSAAKRK